MHRRILLSSLFYLSAVRLAHAAKVFTGIIEGVALGGYDAVSYFSGAEPVQGDPAITADFGGATYRFASAANRDTFKAQPEKYAPQFGGFCAYGTASGYLVSGDPLAWTVHDDKLYINYSLSVREKWSKDILGYVTSANTNWPNLR